MLKKTKEVSNTIFGGENKIIETFGQDAILASKILGIVLTKRSNGADQ